MMVRLLGLKIAITEHFRQETQNSARRVTSHEVSSLLDDVSEATIRMQGATDTHLSQAMFVMREVMEMLNEKKQPIRLPDATILPVPEGGIPTEQTDILDLTMEAQEVRDVLLEVTAERAWGRLR